MKKTTLIVAVLLFGTASCSSAVEPTTVAPPTKVIPTSTPQPTNTPTPTITPEPTATNTPESTATPEPTDTPLPPQSWIWTTPLNTLYEEIYALGYSAEMTHHQEGYWLIYFNDLSSYFTHEGWYWYGNSILAWGGEGDRTDSMVDQIGLRKNYLSYPTSDIDGKADRFFRNMLEEFGYEDEDIDRVMQIASDGLVDARSNLDERICFGQLSSGEYIGVRLLGGDISYVYFVDISPMPLC